MGMRRGAGVLDIFAKEGETFTFQRARELTGLSGDSVKKIIYRLEKKDGSSASRKANTR